MNNSTGHINTLEILITYTPLSAKSNSLITNMTENQSHAWNNWTTRYIRTFIYKKHHTPDRDSRGTEDTSSSNNNRHSQKPEATTKKACNPEAWIQTSCRNLQEHKINKYYTLISKYMLFTKKWPITIKPYHNILINGQHFLDSSHVFLKNHLKAAATNLHITNYYS